mmetsp:Transcript_52441/g.78347  ORF Transcript_52441/g.78347 Transcript_52441/m.78347 type:complete len:217 (+) Transcript_52441:141-791(+)
MTSGKLPKDIGTNERFFTGAMANAINSVLQEGYCVLHQACLGTGATHSDLSATRINTDSWPTTLMVGEGRWNASNLREETRGQMFNELLRHRAIDKESEEEGTTDRFFSLPLTRARSKLIWHFHPPRVENWNKTRLLIFLQIWMMEKKLSGLYGYFGPASRTVTAERTYLLCFDSLPMPWRNWILGGDRAECSTRYQCPLKRKTMLKPWLNIVGRM